MTKTELRQKLEKSYKLLRDELIPIRKADWDKGFLGKERWTVHEIISHIICWDREILRGANDFMKAKRPEYDGKGDDVYNIKFARTYEKLSKKEILEELEKARRAVGDFLKSLTNRDIQDAESKGMRWLPTGDGKGDKMTLESILDQSWHDEEHRRHIMDFKQKFLAIDLKHKVITYLYPKSPFNFDYSFYNPGHFKTDDLAWKKGVKWQSCLWKGKRLGLKFEDQSTPREPKIKLSIYSKSPLDNSSIDSVKGEFTWRYSLDYDLSEFNNKFSRHKVLKTLIKKYHGMRVFNPGSLYEYFIIGIVLQNAPVHRTIKMMRALFERFGSTVKFDNRYFYCYWEPQELIAVKEENLRELKLGYRAKLILQITEEFLKRKIEENKLRYLSKEEQKKMLISLPGIGPATAEYILLDEFHRYDDLKHIPPWEGKLYSRIFFDSVKALPEKRLLIYLNKEFGQYVKLAVHYFWLDIWWRRERGERIEWLEKEIRLGT